MRHVNDAGIANLKQWEGLRLTSYKDSAGILTIGYGHTSDQNLVVKAAQKITEAEAEHLLRLDVQEAEASVQKLVKVTLSDNQFAALVSFVYNIGGGAFGKSTLLRKLNAGDYGSVPHELAKWTSAGGRKLSGLANRRAAEAGLWVKGSFVSSKDVKVAPTKVCAFATPEAIAGYAATGGTVLSTLGGLQGPMAYAVAFAVLAAVAVGGFFLVQRIRDHNP